MNIALGADHAGFDLKHHLYVYLTGKGYTLQDFGTHGTASVDYPDYAHQVTATLAAGHADYGILICGSGNGICIAANRHVHVRAALCWLPAIAALATKQLR